MSFDNLLYLLIMCVSIHFEIDIINKSKEM